MTFKIEFLDRPTEYTQADEDSSDRLRYRWLRTTIGEFKEDGQCCTSQWHILTYQHHWIEQLEALLKNPESKAALITDYASNGMSVAFWSLFREGDSVYIHEVYTLPSARKPAITAANVSDRIGRRSKNVSEWHTTIGDLEGWLIELKKMVAWSIPTRHEAIAKIESLIKGEGDHHEVGLWAQRMNEPENRAKAKELQKEDPSLYAFLDESLCFAGEEESPSIPLYSSYDYQDWLNNFLESYISDENKGNLEKIKKLAHDAGVEIEYEIDSDNFWFINITIKALSDIWVWMNRAEPGGKLYCADLSFVGTRREAYSDDSEAALSRTNDEILETIQGILRKKTEFHPQPSPFNKYKGYILTTINGRRERVKQQRNVFNLPVVNGE